MVEQFPHNLMFVAIKMWDIPPKRPLWGKGNHYYPIFEAKKQKKFCGVTKKEYLCTAFCKTTFFNSIFSMNQYETVFILTPVLSDEQMKETVAKFRNLLTEKGAEILNEETWGLKKMAYAIQKKSTGFYCLLEFKAEPEVIKSLETAYRRDEKVIRFITVKLDKYAAQYAEKRRIKLGKKEEA